MDQKIREEKLDIQKYVDEHDYLLEDEYLQDWDYSTSCSFDEDWESSEC